MVSTGRNFKRSSSSTPCHGQGDLSLDQETQNAIQPNLEHLQGWHIHNFFGQPVLVFHHPHCKKFLPCLQSKPTLFQFKTVAPSPFTTAFVIKYLSAFLISPLCIMRGCHKVFPELSLLQAKQPPLSALLHKRGIPAL